MKNELPTAKLYSFEEMLQTMGFIAYTCTGNSMMPFLRQRKDIVVVKPLSAPIQKYDVVLYKRNNQYILHRILDILPTGYIIAGDHNTFKEYDVTDEMILGVMTKVIRDGKSIYSNKLIYRFYILLWCDFYPIRVLILRIKAKLFRNFLKL